MHNTIVKFPVTNIASDYYRIQHEYKQNGIIHISGFLNSLDLDAIKQEVQQIEYDAFQDLHDNWQNKPTYFFSRKPDTEPEINNDFAVNDYFSTSYCNARVLFEKTETGLLVNRIGHGMHLQEKYHQLQKIIYQNSVLNHLLMLTGLVRPICHLSVYIPKLPKKMGSHVNPHQENTFAYTEPQTAVVLWIALENASIENACMWGILGSNKWPLKYISRVDHQQKKRIFQQVNDFFIPEFDCNNHYYTPLTACAGDALLFHGNFIHCSPTNCSNRSRKAFSMQFIDTHRAYYPATNWVVTPNNKYLFDMSRQHERYL